MKYRLIYGVLRIVYGQILRPLLLEAIKDTENDLDDFVLGLLDNLLLYGVIEDAQ